LSACGKPPHPASPSHRLSLPQECRSAFNPRSAGRRWDKLWFDPFLDIETCNYTDNGAVFYENGQRPLYVNAIAVGKDGMVYTLPRITENGETRSDLVAFPSPLKK
jgi:hypothetical protein